MRCFDFGKIGGAGANMGRPLLKELDLLIYKLKKKPFSYAIIVIQGIINRPVVESCLPYCVLYGWKFFMGFIYSVELYYRF